jgi:putative aldouronate transport system permease protein
LTAKTRRNIPLHLMILVPLVFVIVYNYIPMLGLVIAFKDYQPLSGFRDSPWIGLDNFRFLHELPGFYGSLWNTLVISVFKVIAGMIVPLIVALMLNEVRMRSFKRTVQTIIYMPHFFSWVILSGILIDILSPSQGIVNMFIKWLGYEPVFFLTDNNWFRAVLVGTNEWKEFGFSTIVYLAALTGIDQGQYEAARIDGAGRWRQTWHVTLPGMRPIIVLIMTLSLGNVLNAGFEQVFTLYSPIVYETGDIIDTMVYRIGIVQAQYSLSTALGMFKSVISLILIAVAYTLAYRVAKYRIF